MCLPNGYRVVIGEAKLRDYCLSETHPRGKHKARLFAAALGMTIAHVAMLRGALLHAAANEDAVHTKSNEFGDYYEIQSTLAGPTGSAVVPSVWIIETGDQIPRLVTCYPV